MRALFLMTLLMLSGPAAAESILRCNVMKESHYTNPNIVNVYRSSQGISDMKGDGWYHYNCRGGKSCSEVMFNKQMMTITPVTYTYNEKKPGSAPQSTEETSLHVNRETGKFVFNTSHTSRFGVKVHAVHKEGVCRSVAAKPIL